MKRFNKTNLLIKLLKPMATLILLFTLAINVNAQSMTDNKITTPAISVGVSSINPAVISGNTVSLNNIDCTGTVNYQWQKSNNPNFTSAVNIAGATSQSYDPPAITVTTYFRRVTTFNCESKIYTNISNTVRITVKPVATTAPATITPNTQTN
jgi:large repetitive protein